MKDYLDVLDDGFVKLTHFAGGDLDVVNAARISFHRQHKQMEEGDDKLIGFLMRHRHGTPFESAWFSFHVRAPKPVVCEWMRHRMSSFNEISGRYVKIDYSCYLPDGDAIRTQEGKPGNYTFKPIMDPAKEQQIKQIMNSAYVEAYEKYERLLDLGLAKEVARNVLPFGFYTEFMYSCNARSLMNFLSLRNAPSALKEIREYAIILEGLFAKKMPVTHSYFVQNGRVAP